MLMPSKKVALENNLYVGFCYGDPNRITDCTPDWLYFWMAGFRTINAAFFFATLTFFDPSARNFIQFTVPRFFFI
jgi:hypothetical protein